MGEQTSDVPRLGRDAVGTWVLKAYVSTASDGTKRHNFGAGAIGQAMFDASGNFSMMVVRADLPRFASNNRETGSTDENGAVVRGSLAYFGTYVVNADERGMTFHILGATLPNWIGTTQTRTVSMRSRDQLDFINANASGGGSALIEWLRKTS